MPYYLLLKRWQECRWYATWKAAGAEEEFLRAAMDVQKFCDLLNGQARSHGLQDDELAVDGGIWK